MKISFLLFKVMNKIVCGIVTPPLEVKHVNLVLNTTKICLNTYFVNATKLHEFYDDQNKDISNNMIFVLGELVDWTVITYYSDYENNLVYQQKLCNNNDRLYEFHKIKSQNANITYKTSLRREYNVQLMFLYLSKYKKFILKLLLFFNQCYDIHHSMSKKERLCELEKLLGNFNTFEDCIDWTIHFALLHIMIDYLNIDTRILFDSNYMLEGYFYDFYIMNPIWQVDILYSQYLTNDIKINIDLTKFRHVTSQSVDKLHYKHKKDGSHIVTKLHKYNQLSYFLKNNNPREGVITTLRFI